MVEFKEYVIYIFKENKIKSLIVFVLTLVVTTLSLLEPQLLVILVDKAISHDNFNLLFIVSISYVILIVISALCKYSITVLRTKIKKQTTYKMRTKLLLHIQELPGKYFTEQKTGDILKVIDSDVSALEETGIDFVIDIIKNLLSAISAFVILACINTKLLLIMILMETFMLFLHEKYIKLVSKKLERVRDISGKSMNLLEEFVVHMMDIIITHANILFLKKYLNNEQLYINESTKLEKMIEKNQLTANTLNVYSNLFNQWTFNYTEYYDNRNNDGFYSIYIDVNLSNITINQFQYKNTYSNRISQKNKNCFAYSQNS